MGQLQLVVHNTTSSGSRRNINSIAARRRPEIDPARVVSPFFCRYTNIIASPPRRRNESCVIPPRLNPRAVPSGAVVQDKDQSTFVIGAWTLHYVEIVVHEEHLRRTSGVLF